MDSLSVGEASSNRLGSSNFFVDSEGVSSRSGSTTRLADRDSPESSLNRQDIALGVTPIAARESVLKYQLTRQEEEFTSIENFTVFVGTWNVNGQSPAGSTAQWLACDAEPPDLYVIGFQELDLSKEAFVFNESLKEDEWMKAVADSLHPKATYKLVKHVRLVGMMLIVYVRDSFSKVIRDVAAETVGTGILGRLGNKGGVAVRLDFHNTSVCFVNSHLAAHVSEVERRNQDYHDICARMYFAQFSPVRGLKDHDTVFWLGDLNYRITDLDTETVRELLKEKDWSVLLKSDQFVQQRNTRKVFAGFTEGDIKFQPTYKFDPGTDEWDSSEKARAPAWTDRILWKGEHIRQLSYRSHMQLRISDHKPVSAVFQVGMKVVDPVKYRKIYEEVMKKLDRLENEFLPQVTVDTTEITFETVRFIEPCSKSLTVANTGQVPVQFEFIKKLNDKSICKPWLTVEPRSGFVMPGDKCDIAIEILVDKKTAGALNSGTDQMYDILVLHLMGGKDIFITVSGSYQKSCFGASIDALCRLTVPIAELSPGAIADLETKGAELPSGGAQQEPYPVPKELWFLCDLISGLGLHSDQLFLQSGLRTEVLAIRDWLDTGLPVDRPTVSVHSAAEALMMFLDSLREPVVPFAVQPRCMEASSNYLQCKQLQTQLPSHHRHVFVYICAFLREVLSNSARNGLDPKVLATLFAGIFLRDPPGVNLGTGLKAKASQLQQDQRKRAFLYYFLVNESDD
jgi:phosphatidylinositol-bisphosphatase